MSKYSAEEVREEADGCGLLTRKRLMLRAYADLLERIKADEVVVPDGWAKPEEIESYRRAAAKPRGTNGGGFGVFVSNKPGGIYTLPVYFTHPPAQAAQVPDGATEVIRRSLGSDGHAVSLVFRSQETADSFHARMDEAMKVTQNTAEPVAQGEAVVTSYRDELLSLEARKCPACRGSGKCDDIEPGDISYREWMCTNCKGSGLTTPPAQPRAVPDGWALRETNGGIVMRHARWGNYAVWSQVDKPFFEFLNDLIAAAPSPGESAWR